MRMKMVCFMPIDKKFQSVTMKNCNYNLRHPVKMDLITSNYYNLNLQEDQSKGHFFHIPRVPKLFLLGLVGYCKKREKVKAFSSS